MLDSDPVLSGFPSTPISEVPIGVLLLTANLYRSGAGTVSLCCEGRELGPGSLFCAAKDNAVLFHSINYPAVN